MEESSLPVNSVDTSARFVHRLVSALQPSNFVVMSESVVQDTWGIGGQEVVVLILVAWDADEGLQSKVGLKLQGAWFKIVAIMNLETRHIICKMSYSKYLFIYFKLLSMVSRNLVEFRWPGWRSSRNTTSLLWWSWGGQLARCIYKGLAVCKQFSTAWLRNINRWLGRGLVHCRFDDRFSSLPIRKLLQTAKRRC